MELCLVLCDALGVPSRGVAAWCRLAVNQITRSSARRYTDALHAQKPIISLRQLSLKFTDALCAVALRVVEITYLAQRETISCQSKNCTKIVASKNVRVYASTFKIINSL